MKLLFSMPHIRCNDKFERCLRSLKERTANHDIFLYICNSFGNDRTKSEIENILSTIGFNNYKIDVSKNNFGCSVAWNVGIKYGIDNNFDYIIIANDDMLYSKDWFENCLKWFEKYPKLDCVHPMIVGDIELDEIGFDNLCENTLLPKHEDNFNTGIAFGAMVCKKSLFEKIGLLDENYYPAFYEDIDYAFRMFLNDDCYFITCGDSFIYHFKHSTTGKIYINSENCKKYYYKKWEGKSGEDASSNATLRVVSYINDVKSYESNKRVDKNFKCADSSIIESPIIIEEINSKKKLVYISYLRSDFLDDVVFSGLRYFSDKYDLYYIIPDGADYITRKNRCHFKTRTDWARTASVMKPFDYNTDYDICIVGQLWQESQACYNSFKGKVKFTCCIDGMDNPTTPQVDHDLLIRRETADTKIFVPFACPYDIVYKENTKIPKYFVNFQMSDTYKTRRDFFNKIVQINPENSIITFQPWGKEILGNAPFTPQEDWWNVLEESKAIMNDRGAGGDAFRFWEGMATGNFVVSSRRQIFNDLPSPPNVIWFDDLNELDSIICDLRKVSDDELMVVRKKSKEFVKQHHMPRNRTEKVLLRIEEKINERH